MNSVTHFDSSYTGLTTTDEAVGDERMFPANQGGNKFMMVQV